MKCMTACQKRRMQTYQSLSNPGNKIFREAELMGHLSAPLKQELQLARHLPALRALGLVEGRLKTSSALAGRLSAALERRIFLDGEVLVHQGIKGDGMHFLREGEVHVYQLASTLNLGSADQLTVRKPFLIATARGASSRG